MWKSRVERFKREAWSAVQKTKKVVEAENENRLLYIEIRSSAGPPTMKLLECSR